jgi:hypothetical protein
MALADSYVKFEFAPEMDLEEQRKAALLEEMGINQNDTDKLRKMMLSADEAVCARHEEQVKIRQHKGRKDQWEEFIDAKRRMGRVLHHSEIIERLRQIVPSLIVAPGAQQNRVGLYVIRNMAVSEIPNYPLTANGLAYTDVPIYIGWLELGESPEYEIDLVNDVDVAIGQKRGWRTLLLRLIARRAAHCKQCELNPKFHSGQKGRSTSLVSEQQAEKVFGYPSNGPTASNYRRQLWEFRNGIL